MLAFGWSEVCALQVMSILFVNLAMIIYNSAVGALRSPHERFMETMSEIF